MQSDKCLLTTPGFHSQDRQPHWLFKLDCYEKEVKNQAAHLLIWYKENQALSLLRRSHNLRKQVRSCSGSMHSLSHWPSTPERSVVK